jgi:hypothetical protein
MKDLYGTKLLLACVKKALGMDLKSYTPPPASSPELAGGVTLLACSGKGLMKRCEAADSLWMHGLWNEGYPGNFLVE